jgi:hypothetical protein
MPDTGPGTSDFVVVPADLTYLPRNSATPANVCSGSTNPSGVGAADPSLLNPGDPTLLTVTVTPGANPPSTGLMVTGELSSIGGTVGTPFDDDGLNGDLVAGDNVFSFLANVSPTKPLGTKVLPITITDAQGRMGSASIMLYLPMMVPIAHLHTLLDPVTWAPTDTTNLYIIEGRVTTHVKLTTPANAQFYIERALTVLPSVTTPR